MSGLETFLWGLGGAALGYIALNILPILTAEIEGKEVRVQWGWLFAALFIYVLVGGLLAVVIGDATSPKHAAFYGMGWNTIVKGGSEIVRLGGTRG